VVINNYLNIFLFIIVYSNHGSRVKQLLQMATIDLLNIALFDITSPAGTRPASPAASMTASPTDNQGSPGTPEFQTVPGYTYYRKRADGSLKAYNIAYNYKPKTVARDTKKLVTKAKNKVCAAVNEAFKNCKTTEDADQLVAKFRDCLA
jgi:hypothetical protein